jgi:NACHT domain
VLQEIEAWELHDTNSTVYWLKGVAGCGKSTIAQTFAEQSAARGRLGASFCCSRDFPDRRDLRLIFPTLARDLAHRYPKFKVALVKIIRAYPDVAEDSLAVQFEKLIVEPLGSTGLFTSIVVDALDECTDKEPVSAFLSVLARYVDVIPNVKFFITGRPEDHIRAGFAIPSLRTKELPLHDVDSLTVDSDIRSFVTAWLDEIATRDPQSMNSAWPSDEEVDAVTKKASGHFIVASVILGFVDQPPAMPQERLKLIVRMLNSTVLEGKSGIDWTYCQVLAASFNNIAADDSKFFEELRIVMASIVLALHPLSRASLARILGMSPERIWMILRSLHSVLIVPDSPSGPIRICHKSFADFLTDPDRCSDVRFFIDGPVHHSKLGALCLKLMRTTLTKNICGLPRYAMNKDIEDLDARREKYIGSALAYSCEYWGKHLQMSTGAVDDAVTVFELVEQFFRDNFLTWLEVLSIETNLRAAIYSILDVRSWLKDLKVPWINHETQKRTWLDTVLRSISRKASISYPYRPSVIDSLNSDYESHFESFGLD